MKRFSTLLLLMIIMVATMQAQNSFNSKPDAIVGTYRVVHDGEVSKVRVYRCSDGSYAAQCIYLQDSIDKNGQIATRFEEPRQEPTHSALQQSSHPSRLAIQCQETALGRRTHL